MRIIESKIEQIDGRRIEIAVLERTSGKWIAGMVLLSAIILGLDGFMCFLFIKSLQSDWFHKLLAIAGNIASMAMIWDIGKYLACKDYPQETILSVEILRD